MSDPRANDTADNFGIGATTWPGIAKLMEEAGEVVQVCAKLIATGGRTDHWSGDDLAVRLVEEMGDLEAALRYVRAHNLLDRLALDSRRDHKFNLFQEWDGKARRGLRP